MTDSEIVKVVNKLVGSITPVADSGYDGEIYDNIMLMGSVVDALVCRMGNMICENQDSQFGSVQKCTSKATEILKTINNNINEYLEEMH